MLSSRVLYTIVGGILTALFLRCATTLHPYSGQHTPPMFGDYEAQRHWMEITYHLPAHEWYANTTDNDLLYWGLDYPPLTAYHSLLCGYLAHHINPLYVALNVSRGYESVDHKLFMRYTVLAADCLIYLPAICLYFYLSYAKQQQQGSPGETTASSSKQINRSHSKRKSVLKKPTKSQLETHEETTDKKHTQKGVTFSNPIHNIQRPNTNGSDNGSGSRTANILHSFLFAIFYPGVILIDHGHFQYNCISLGLTVMAVNCVLSERPYRAAVFFTLALNYKQMELYHALPFFCHYLNVYLVKDRSWPHVFKLAGVVLLTFTVVWLPFIVNHDRVSIVVQIIRRLFPLARGVFEDKVANFWCTLNIVIKLKTVFDHSQMTRLCLMATLLAVFPTCVDLLLRGHHLQNNKDRFLLSLINCSLGFYLFSYQVHEKTILVVSVAVLLYFHNDPFTCYWFLYISCFSMTPLLIKDGLLVAYISLSMFYLILYRLLTKRRDKRPRSHPPPAPRGGANIHKFGRNQFIRELLITLLNVNDGDKDYTDIVTLSFRHLVRNIQLVKKFIIKSTFVLSYLVSMVLFTMICVFEPPDELPDLFTVLISVYSFIHFILFFIYFNYCQIKSLSTATNTTNTTHAPNTNNVNNNNYKNVKFKQL